MREPELMGDNHASIGLQKRLGRRAALRSGLILLAGGAAYSFVGCGDDDNDTPSPAATSSTTPAAASSTATPPPATASGGLPTMATWRMLETPGLRPAPRRDHSLTGDGRGEFVYLFGGRGDAGPLADLWVYDVRAGTWTELAASGGPAPRFGHNAALDPASGQMVMFGGQAGATFFGDAWGYGIESGEWSLLAADGAGPRPRYGAASAFDAAARTLLISHGFTNDGRFDDTWSMAGGVAAWRELSPASGERPIRRCLVRGTYDAGRERLLIFGGQSNEAPFHGDLWALDRASGGWTELPAGPAPRNLYALAQPGDAPYFIIAGGATAEGDSNDVWLFDFAGESWHEVTPQGAPPAPRHGHDATWLAARGSMLMFGGQAGGSHSDELWELTPA